ncbi:MAG: MarR family transcriptional regulator [Nocardioidaceae bacterium]|nr:MarR family transcriptional regulator [Nocardioidaceae bacterium]
MQSSPSSLTDPVPAPETAEDALMSLMMALGRRLRQRQPGDAVDFSAFPILKLLSHHGPMRVSALAQVIGLDASTVSRHVKQLEDRGLLERTEDPDDRRASQVAVSKAGTTVLAEGFAARRGLITAALDGWTDDERDTLRDLLHRVSTALLTDSPAPTDDTKDPA